MDGNVKEVTGRNLQPYIIVKKQHMQRTAGERLADIHTMTSKKILYEMVKVQCVRTLRNEWSFTLQGTTVSLSQSRRRHRRHSDIIPAVCLKIL